MYTVQIFWKGDPGIENFTIRFASEETMAKWYTRLLEQKENWDQQGERQRSTGVSSTEFTYMRDQPAQENPYRQKEDDEEEDTERAAPSAPFPSYAPHSEFPGSRNSSNTSLRSRSTTGESGPPPSAGITGRMQPPRLPAGSISQQGGLTLRTQQLPGYLPSPAEKFAESYFSPTMDSPMSSRTSSSSGMYPFPRQPIPANAYYEEGHGRYTAPVMSRTASRENSTATNSYSANSRGSAQRPSFPAAVGMHSSQQLASSRNRSASSPDIHAQRRAMTAPRPPMPEGSAQHIQNAEVVTRSQSNSPSLPNGSMPRMAGTQSPKLPRERSYNHAMQEPPYFDSAAAARADPRFAQSTRSNTPTQHAFHSLDHAVSPPLSSSTSLASPDTPQPTQLKVKVHATAAGQVLTLVVPLNISYQSLKDRIDAKLQRSTNISLSDRTGNQVKLKYLDEDDLVSIQSDEDVQTAFETWREQRGEGLGGMGEIELYCQ